MANWLNEFTVRLERKYPKFLLLVSNIMYLCKCESHSLKHFWLGL